MIRGLCHSWKQVLYYNFDVTMKADLLFRLIIFAEDAGVTVTSVVFDLGNRGLLNELGVDADRPSFPSPYDPQRNIYVIPDPVHMLKLFRNHLLDDGLVLGNHKSIIVDKMYNESSIKLQIKCNVKIGE